MPTGNTIDSSDLGLDPDSGREKDLFRWFLASFLFGKRIRQGVARNAFDILVKSGIDSPRRILGAGWGRLVEKLDEGGYVRYDESTARYLLETSRLLEENYQGRIREVFERSSSEEDLKARLQEFKGVGPKTVEIFLRDIPRLQQLIGPKSGKK